MSSVGGSGSGNRSDEVQRRNREEYQARESESAKKHNKEIRRLAEAHQAEIRRLREGHDEQMKSMQNRSHDTITQRDRKYQNEVAAMKEAHRQQMQRLVQESQSKIDIHREARDNEAKMLKQANDNRVEDLKAQYNETLREQDATYTHQVGRQREDQARAIERQREYLNRQHKKELSAVEADRTDKVGSSQLELGRLREQTSRRLKNQEARHFSDRKRIEDNLMAERNRLVVTNDESLQHLRDGFRQDLKVEQEKFARQTELHKEVQEKNSENLANDVNGRVGRQIEALEAKIRLLKEGSTREQVENRRKAQMQIANIEREYGKRVDDYKNQRDSAVAQFNDRNAKDIQAVRQETSDLLQDSSRYYRDRMQMESHRQRQALDSMRTDLTTRHEQQKQQADVRVANVREKAAQNEDRLRENFTSNMSAVRDSNNEEKRDLLRDTMKERDEAIQRVKDQLSQSEVRSAEKLNDTVNRYEKRLAELQDRFTKEKRLTGVQQKRTMETMKRAHQLELETAKTQYEEKLAKMSQQHKEDVELMNRRHDAKMDDVLVNLKKT